MDLKNIVTSGLWFVFSILTAGGVVLLFLFLLHFLGAVSCCSCSHINSHDQVRDHRTGSNPSGVEEYPTEEINKTISGTHTFIAEASAKKYKE